jgi:excisionase family DNA binding protein
MKANMSETINNKNSSAVAAQQEKKLLTREEAANFLGIKAQTLAVWASAKRYSLNYVKIGRRVLYRQTDLDAFIVANTVTIENGGGA